MEKEKSEEKQKVFIKDYLMVIRAAKHNYFSALYHVYKQGW